MADNRKKILKEDEMKASIIKKMMTGVLAASLVMAPAMSVGATTVTGGGSCAE